ncbi:MAG TPA: hypothetical protein VIK80_02110 [Flavihumibacter sp.]|jgi:hypothetical protein
MKNRFLYWQLWIIVALGLTSILAIAGENKSWVESGPAYRDSIIIQKLNNNSRHIVNIYTNQSQKVLFFSARGEEGKNYQFLLFREKGKLVTQSKIKSRETTVVSKPEKGKYYYEVFSESVLIESGMITVQ